MSAAFSTSRGIKQGCPLSPILFSILLSGLERYVLSSHTTAGFTLGGVRTCLTSYADDITLICKTELELSEIFHSTSYFL